MDCACYSFLYMFKLQGFDPNSQISDIAVVTEPPILLDEVKSTIKSELIKLDSVEVTDAETGEKKTKRKEQAKPTYSTIESVMGIKQEPARSFAADVPTLASIADIHEKTRAIIYSVISTEANYAIKAATHRGDNPPFGDDMKPFFKSPFGVLLNGDFLMYVFELLKKTLQAVQGESPKLFD